MPRTVVLLAVLAVCCSPALAQTAASLLLNGGFEGRGGWTRNAISTVASDRGGRCLLAESNGASALQDLAADPDHRTYTCAVDVRTQDVQPLPNGGSAYCAVYQLDANGRWVVFKDFVALTGTHPWQRHDFTFELVPQAQTISIRCGLYNVTGQAWFDNWTLVPGDQAAAYDETQEASAMGANRLRAAVFYEPGFPAEGAASSPQHLVQLLRSAGIEADLLGADELARRERLNPTAFALLVLPYGASFPARAQPNVTDFLRRGGHFISTGGYAFNDLVVRDGAEWIPERIAAQRRMEAASANSIVRDPGFEAAADAPVGGTVLDASWRRDSTRCTLSDESPREGNACAQVTVDPQAPHEDRWYADIKPQPGATYRVSGWVRTRDVKPVGFGFAYIALYEYGPEGKLGKWSDFAVVSGTQDWKQFHYDFSPAASTERLHLKMGLYRASGTAWFDDVRLVDITGADTHVMNTSTGKPGDGLEVSDAQIGVFDADYRLRRAASAQASPGQRIFAPGETVGAPLDGWAASGVQGMDNARHVPLLDATDRFGRPRGPAAALMINYNGPFAGSMWGYFGVASQDLFDGSHRWLDRGFIELARFMLRGVYMRNLSSDLALYDPGQTIERRVWVENLGLQPVEATVTFQMLPAGDPGRAVGTDRVTVTVPPGDAREVTSPWRQAGDDDLYQIVAELTADGTAIDQMTSGCVVRSPSTIASGTDLRFRDNYYQLNGRPVFLFGSDTWSNVYGSSCEDPWTWHLDHVAARDYGFNVYENLQTYRPPDYTLSGPEWLQFEAMAQSCQREGLTFMPCQLVGHNVAVAPDDLERQAAFCAEYGRRMRQYPGLLYYLNGDFQFQIKDPDAVSALWNQWLAERYRTEAALAEAWGDEVHGTWGALTFPPPPTRRWDSARDSDRLRFQTWLTSRWVQRHVGAVRSADEIHPITSEYYQQPFDGMDLPLTIGDQDASNIGYFDIPVRDLDMLPLRLRFNDLRMRGKSLGLGEYGVKTHPAWTPENGAGGYHLVRTEEEQKQLFMGVAHYGLGLGACKVQNWCLRDSSQWVFPWGVFYPNGRMPRDVAAWHRNLSLVWRHFAPVYQAPATAVLVTDSLRLGADPQPGVEAPYNAFRALFALGADFNVINEEHIASLGPDTHTLVWPSPMAVSDACYNRVLDWVRQGGTLLLTGDITRDAARQRTRTGRLEELCGARSVRELAAPPARTAEGAEAVELGGATLSLKPCVQVEAVDSQVIAASADATPLVLDHTLGAGRVIYCADALELGPPDEVLSSLTELYARTLDVPAASRPPQGVTRCRQPLSGGGAFTMAFNGSLTEPSSVDLPAGADTAHVSVAPRLPAFTATDGSGDLVAVGASGQATLNGLPLLTGDAQVICLSLDRAPLASSAAVLVCPFSKGTSALRSTRAWADPITLVGETVDGAWATYETRLGAWPLTFDDDTMTCLAIVCEKADAPHWTSAIAAAMRHPESIAGY